MGLFDFFKKKQDHITGGEKKCLNELEYTSEGSHGDHWGALYGFEKFQTSEEQRESLKTILMSKEGDIVVGKYKQGFIDFKDFCVKLITLNKNLVSGFPQIHTSKSIDITVKKVSEWEHVDGVEGQIEGKGKDTFGLSFFATDYLKNKDLYKNKTSLNICLSGMAYSVEKAGKMERFADDFVGYMPNAELRQGSVIDYYGKLLEVKPVEEKELGITGYILTVNLVDMDGEDFFIIDLFANSENIAFKNLKVGDRISGTAWLQGKIK